MTRHVAVARVRFTVRRHPIPAFFVLAYGLSWTAWLPFLLSAHGLDLWPVRFPTGSLLGAGPGVYLGPFGAALIVTAVADGRAGLRRWRARLLRWRVAPRWYGFALLAYPAVVLVAMLASAPALRAPTSATFLMVVPMLVGQALTSGLGEEPGWRDFAQPRMQARFGPLPGTLLLGVLWGCWHLPLFWTDWSPTGPSVAGIAGFLCGATAFSVVIAWVFNRSGESLPITILLHAGSNTVQTVVGLTMYPEIPPHHGFWSPSLIAAAAVGALVVALTRGRLGYPDRPGGGPSRACPG